MVYAKEVSTKDKRFANRETQIIGTREVEDVKHIDLTRISIPDRDVICNGCNDNIFPGNGYLIYLGKRDLKADRPYDIYCVDCLKKYFPKAEIIK